MQKLFSRSKKYSTFQLSKYLRELSLMIDSGLTLFNAINASSKNWDFSKNILDNIALGQSFSSSLANPQLKIDDTAINFIKVSEQRGDLSGGLRRASIYLENKDKFRKRMVSALSYPIFVITLSFVALFVLISVLIPSFDGIYSGMGIELPLISKIVMSFGQFLFNNLHIIFILILSIILMLMKYAKTEKGLKVADKVLMKLPFIGGLRREMVFSRFFDNMSQAIKAGISVPDSIYMSGNVLSSPMYQDSIKESLSLVESGNTLSETMDKKLFPPVVLNLIAVGESTANLDLVFNELKKYFEEAVERKIKMFSSMVEPISTLVVGAVVGIIVLAMFMPMINIVGTMSF